MVRISQVCKLEVRDTSQNVRHILEFEAEPKLRILFTYLHRGEVFAECSATVTVSDISIVAQEFAE